MLSHGMAALKRLKALKNCLYLRFDTLRARRQLPFSWLRLLPAAPLYISVDIL